MHHLLRPESAGGDSGPTAAAVAFASGGDAIAEVGAGYRSLNSFCPARSVALSRTRRHVKRTSLRRVQLGALLARPFQTVGIAEASGLHLLHRRR